MRALIQKRDGEFASVNACSAFLGLRDRGYEIEFFGADQFDDKAIDADTLVAGGVPITRKALTRLGVPMPLIDSIPASIRSFAKRDIWTAPIGEVRNYIDQGKFVFVKPTAGELKRFAGHVIANYVDLTITTNLHADEIVWCSDTVNMLSEYRVYVTRGDAIGCKHYAGDFRKQLDFSIVDGAIAAFRDAPQGYAIDFAVTDKDETVLIEVNDGFSLGSFGLHPLLYSGLLEARWQELVAPLK